MKIDKIKDTYNDYKVELSWGQLQSIKNALAQSHTDPISDELYAELQWYLDNLPGPGEDTEKEKEKTKKEKQPELLDLQPPSEEEMREVESPRKLRTPKNLLPEPPEE